MSGGINSEEQRLCDWMYSVIKEGQKARRENTGCPHPAYTLKSFLHVQGWVSEDLRIGLCKANPTYRATQVAYDPELAKALEKLA